MSEPVIDSGSGARSGVGACIHRTSSEYSDELLVVYLPLWEGGRGDERSDRGHPRVHPGLRYPDNPDYTTLSPYISMIQTPCQHRGRFAVPNAHHRGARRHPEATKLPSADANSCALCTRRKVKCSKVSRSGVKPQLRRQTIPCTGCLERGQGALCQRETVSVKGRIIK
jgi:hypothetical protein